MRRALIWVAVLTGLLLLADWVISVPSSCYEFGQSAKDAEQSCAPFNGPLVGGAKAVLYSFSNAVEAHATTIIALAMIVIAFFAVALRRTTAALLRTAHRQNADIRESLRIAADTAKAAHESADAAKRQTESFRLSERAYVKMSHTLPGVRMEPDGNLWVVVQLKNWGRTPARVTNVVINRMSVMDADALPELLSYDPTVESERLATFLVPGEEFFFSETAGHMLEFGKATLCFYGYVDYLDAFDQRHRAGYARLWDKEQDQRERYTTDEAFLSRNNLILVTKDAYNYDRMRAKGEGNDWN